MWGKSAFFLALFFVGCTMPNPNYAGDNGGGGVGGGGSAPDMGTGGGGSVDMSGGGDHADMSGGGTTDGGSNTCAGKRMCATNPVASQTCENGHFTSDRLCPEGDVSVLDAQCNAGYCEPPVGSSPCDVTGGPSEDYCFNAVGMDHSCQPFVNPQSKAISWSCAVIVGQGASGDACTKGSQCRSGFCGSNGTCFRPCNGNGNCPQSNIPLSCKKVTFTVEGVTVSANSCVP